MLDTSTSLKGSEDARKKDTEGKGILILDDTLSHHESAKHMEFAGSSMTTPITHSPGVTTLSQLTLQREDCRFL
jgi:hypothetical protein